MDPRLYRSVLVTGAAGMLGRALAASLRRRGVEPVALPRASFDIADESSVRAAFDRHRPTLVLNCAAHTKVDLCEDEPEKADAINGRAVGTLARACREHGAALVHYSTDFVFDGKSRRPYRPDDPVAPLSAYGRSKLLGERELQARAPERWLLIRTAWVYGPGGMNFPRVIVERGRAGTPLKVVDDETGSPTFTHDLADATLVLLDSGASGTWHVTNAGAVSRFEYARAVLEEFGVRTELTPISTAEWFKIRPKQAIRPAYSVLDVEPFAKQVGRSMRPWREALRDYRSVVEREGFDVAPRNDQ
jgi:dTDP-4-dehydrorhamnose reductase